MDAFTVIYNKMKTDSYFQDFTTGGKPKLYKLDSAPTLTEPFITANISQRRQKTGWANFSGIFSIYGTQYDWETMYAIADELERFFGTLNLHKLGEFTIAEGTDPVRERVVLNISASFGGVIQ